MAKGVSDYKKMPDIVKEYVQRLKDAPFTAFLPSYATAVRHVDVYYLNSISHLKKYKEEMARLKGEGIPREPFLRQTDEFLATQAVSTGIPRQWTSHQKKVQDSLAVDRFMWGANRGGKTFYGAIEAAATAYGEPINSRWEAVERPGKVWACCPDYQNSGRVVQVPMLRWALGKLGKWKEAQRVFEVIPAPHLDPSLRGQIAVKGYDSGAEKFAGADLDLIWNDEPPPEPVWEEQGMRIGEGITRFLWTLTLVGANAAWIVRRFYRKWLDDGRPDEPCWINFALDDNPHLNKEDVKKVKERFKDDPEQADIRIKGGMPQMSGFLYPMLEAVVHVVDDFEIPGVHRDPKDGEQAWTLYRCIDPGIRNECYVGYVAVAPDGTGFLYREFCESDRSIPEICEWTRIEEADREVFKWTTIDIAAAQRDLGTGDTRTQIFAKNGVICLQASNREVDTAVSTMRDVLMWSKDPKGNLRRRPKLLFFRSCTKTWKSMRNAAWKPKATRTSEDPKEVTLKKDDHAENAIRYLYANYGGPQWHPPEDAEYAAEDEYVKDQTTGY